MARKINKRTWRGLSTIEAALVMPVLVLLSLGVIEYGWMFFHVQQITNAAREGARVGIRADATEGQVSSRVTEWMNAAGLGDSGYQLIMATTSTPGVPLGDKFSVEIRVPYENINLTGATIIPVPSTLKAKITMAKEGP